MINDINAYKNAKTTKDRLIVGKEYEDFVAKLLETQCGGTVTHSDRDTDIYDHIDLFWNSPKGGLLSIDVKGPKRASKKDNNFDYKYIWVELQNVLGKPGWLLGHEDIVAFVIKDSVLFVKRNKLLNLVMRNITDNHIYTKLYRNDIYKKYQRAGEAKDVILRVPVSDIYNIKWFELIF